MMIHNRPASVPASGLRELLGIPSDTLLSTTLGVVVAVFTVLCASITLLLLFA